MEHQVGCLSSPYHPHLLMEIRLLYFQKKKNVFRGIKVQPPHLAASLLTEQACCWTHSRASHWQRNKTVTSREMSDYWFQVTYKLSIIGVEVHGLCVSFSRGMDFIRWYIGGHAMRACSVWVFRVREKSSQETPEEEKSQSERIQRWCNTSSPCWRVLSAAKTLVYVSTSHFQ